MQQLIPLDSAPGQAWQVAVNINGSTSLFFVTLNYNEVGNFWEMTIEDSNQNLLLDSLPLVTGTNLLGQFAYLGIGSLYIVNASGVATPNYPNNTDLGTDFVMVWGDNVTATEVAA
jgi:hypothetical protein